MVKKTSGKEKKPEAKSGSLRHCMDGNNNISQLKTLGGVKPTVKLVKLSVREIVQCAVNCTFKRSFSCEPVLQQTKAN